MNRYQIASKVSNDKRRKGVLSSLAKDSFKSMVGSEEDIVNASFLGENAGKSSLHPVTVDVFNWGCPVGFSNSKNKNDYLS